MPGPGLSEWAIIAHLQQRLAGAEAHAQVRSRTLMGIGDDCAVLAPRGRLVWTIDASIEHVHFERAWLSAPDIAFRATQAAVSDVAAMGARPLAALAQLTLPRATDGKTLRALARGQAQASQALGCPVIGGNISRGERLELVTTVLGELPPQAGRVGLTRAGARAGQELWLVGELGLAAAGLRALQSGRTLRGRAARCVSAWRRPSAQVEWGPQLVGRATAALDVSDGLVGDAAHLAEASGVALHLDVAALSQGLHPALRAAARALHVEPLELALFGGEDYALLATGPRARRPAWAQRVGSVRAGEGVWLEDAGSLRPVSGGFEHTLAAP